VPGPPRLPRYAALQLDERKQARFPPFAANALLCATADEVGTALDWLKAARAEALPYAQAFGVMVFDPVPMRMVRLARRERASWSKPRPPGPAGLPERLERAPVGPQTPARPALAPGRGPGRSLAACRAWITLERQGQASMCQRACSAPTLRVSVG
jgi:hypothetical protein